MNKKSIDELLPLLEQAQEQRDDHSVATYYLELGKAYREDGKIPKAVYYLNRFDSLASGDDSLYTDFQQEDNQAMDWITALDAEQEPYEKAIQRQVVEKAADLNHMQKMQWLLLTMARFCALFQRISALSGFEGFEKLEEIIDCFSQGLYGEPDGDREDEISEYLDFVDEVFDSSLMNDYTKKVEIPNQKSFVPADLEGGDIGTFFFSMAYNALLSFVYDELEEDDINMEFVSCGILADYYYRTTDTEIQKERKIQEETDRIFSDYDFIKEAPDQERFQEKIENYKKIMLV